MVEVDAADYVRLAAAVKGADKAVARAIRKRVREAAKPIGEHVITKGSDSMPSRGGLRERLQSVRPTVSVLAKGASINLRKGANFTSLDAGVLRHPVFKTRHMQRQKKRKAAGRLVDRIRGIDRSVLSVAGDRTTWKWVQQGVPSGTYTGAFADLPPGQRATLDLTITDAMKELGL